MAINVDVAYNSNTIATLENVDSVPITYGGNTIATLSDAGTKTLNCNGQYMNTNVGIGSKTLNCAGQIMASNIVVTASSSRLYLYKGDPIDDCAAVTRRWAASDLRYTSSSSSTRTNPSIGTTSDGKYRTIQLGTTSSSGNPRQGAYVAGISDDGGMITDLSGYSKLVLEYDLVTSGTNSQYRLFFVCFFASKSWVYASGYQTSATNRVATSSIRAGQTLTDQKLELNISNTGGYVQVGIGMNETSNPGVVGNLTIKAVYAEP